jgi:hypothetical protein
MWRILRKTNPSSRRSVGPISKHVSCLGAKKILVIGPDEGRNQEWLRWRGPATIYCYASSSQNFLITNILPYDALWYEPLKTSLNKQTNNTKSSVFWNIKLCSPVKINRRFGRTYRLHLQRRITSQASNQHKARKKQSTFLDYLTFRPWRLTRYSPPIHRLTFNRLHGVMHQKIESLTTTAVRTSNPEFFKLVSVCSPWPLSGCSVNTARDSTWKR